MKNYIFFFIATLMLTACATDKASNVEADAPAVPSSPNEGMSLVTIGTRQAFIFMPTKTLPGLTRWVWLAPAFATGPDPKQMGTYVARLRAEGFAVVGCDVGESYGSPQGRVSFFDFYNYLKANGFESSGVFILQSRGGLHGYSFLKEHPEAAKAVAGIYPLLSYDDYAGPAGFAPAWGLSVADFNLVKSSTDPLVNVSSFTFPIYHVHGDQDHTTSYANDVLFVGLASNATLETVPGQAHEWYSPEFFANENIINFIKTEGL